MTRVLLCRRLTSILFTVSLVALLSPVVRAQQPSPAAKQEADNASKTVCMNKETSEAPKPGTKTKKSNAKTLGDKVVPLSLVICEVENALDAYQQSKDVDDKVLPRIVSADFDFKTVVDTKGSLGIGLFIFKLIGGSVDKQKTNELDFQYVPKSLLKTAFEGGRAQTFQEQLLEVIKSAAKAVKEQEAVPARPGEKDPLVFKQLTMTVSYGVTVAGSAGISVPISIVTLTAELDRSKNDVQSVKLVFSRAKQPSE